MLSDAEANKPVVRIIHHMARSGGTIICRCLASMNKVVLLSEIHPKGVSMFNPLVQAHDWYGLLNPDDVELARSGKLDFTAAIQLISNRCEQQGRILVLRDWSHLDYTGLPFTQASYRSLLAEALEPDFELIRYSTVRHPLDQWLSLSSKPVFRDKLGPAKFLRGASRFAESAVTTGFLRYEDFTHDSDHWLQSLCNAMNLEYDPAYGRRWQAYKNITGDILPGRSAGKISSLPRQAVDVGEEQRFTALPHYQQTISRLGYQN